MNPEGYPSASVPLQPRPYDGFSGQPGGPTVVQSTTVNFVAKPPKDHTIWSIFNFVYINPFCLGLAALVHSIKARDRKVVGDLEGARRYGSTARTLNIITTVLTGLLLLIGIITFSVITAQASSYYYRYNSYGGGSSYNYNYRG